MNNKNGILLSLLFISLFSCEKVIDVDLNDTQPTLVIEGVLAAGQHNFTVNISETTSYFDNETPTFRNDAIVTLLDNNGQEFTIPLFENGAYQREITAEPGLTYTLQVTVDEITYIATATVPSIVPILELEIEYQEKTGFFDEGYRVFTRFSDDPVRRNFYRQIYAIDSIFQRGGEHLQVSDDELFDGSERARLNVFNEIFEKGTTITIILQHIDANSFEYLNSLADIVNTEGGGPNSASAAPGNPNTNWDSNILGYFGAIGSDTLSIDLPE